MSSSFDPYRDWLDIPPEEQPPHHYRLLGIPLFETNSAVISLAADRQVGILESLHDGEHGFLAEQLIKSIETARVCLLDGPRKTSYDAKLRLKLSSANVAAEPPPAISADSPASVSIPQPATNGVMGETSGSPVGSVPSLQVQSLPPQLPTSSIPVQPPAMEEPADAFAAEEAESPIDIANGEGAAGSDWAPVPDWMNESSESASPKLPAGVPRPSSPMPASARSLTPPAGTPARSLPRAAPPPAESARTGNRPSIPRAAPMPSNDSSSAEADTSSSDSLDFLGKPGVKSSPATDAAGVSRPRGSFPPSPGAKGRPPSSPGKVASAGRGKLPGGTVNQTDAAAGSAPNPKARMAAIFVPTVVVSLILIIYLTFFTGDDKAKPKKSTTPKPSTPTSSPWGNTPKKK